MRRWVALGLLVVAAGCYDRPDHRRRDVIGAPADGVATEQEVDRSRPTPEQLSAQQRDRAIRQARQKFTEVGTVRKSGDQGITLARPGGRALELVVQPLTSIQMDGRPMTPRALPEGAEVRASYVVNGKQNLAESIEVLRPTPQARKPAGKRGK